jgi:integrase/recombinase XerD
LETFELLARLPARLGCEWLFWHHDGSPYRNASSRFAAMVRAEAALTGEAGRSPPQPSPSRGEGASFRPFRFHDLRHRHAVDWLKAGGSIYDLQKRLGHSSIKVTEYYLDYLTGDEVRTAKAGPQAGERRA